MHDTEVKSGFLASEAQLDVKRHERCQRSQDATSRLVMLIVRLLPKAEQLSTLKKTNGDLLIGQL